MDDDGTGAPTVRFVDFPVTKRNGSASIQSHRYQMKRADTQTQTHRHTHTHTGRDRQRLMTLYAASLRQTNDPLTHAAVHPSLL